MNQRPFLTTAAAIATLSGLLTLAYAAVTPTGPYQKSCKTCSVNGRMGPAGKLFCNACTRRDGSKQASSLELKKDSTTPIFNCDGNLRYGACQ